MRPERSRANGAGPWLPPLWAAAVQRPTVLESREAIRPWAECQARPRRGCSRAASSSTRGIRRRTIPSSGPGGRCRSGGAGRNPDSVVHRRPSPSRRGPVSAANGSLVPERDAPASEVVGGHGERDAVAGEHADAETTHLARNGGEHGVAVRQMDAKGGIGQDGLHDAVELYRFFLGHRYSVRAGLRKNKGGTGALAKSRLDFSCCKASRKAGGMQRGKAAVAAVIGSPNAARRHLPLP